MTSRVRILADQIRLSTNESGAGDLIFEPGTVNGVAGTVLRSALIGDLTVDTLQLENESVTLPSVTTYTGSTGLLYTSNNWTTKLEDSFTITGVAGSTIYLQIQADIYSGGQGEGDPPAYQYDRLLLNDTQIEEWVNLYAVRTIKFSIQQIAATGSPQTISIKWQVAADWPVGGGGYTYIYAAKILRVAMKR